MRKHRIVVFAAATYLGIALLMVALENRLVFIAGGGWNDQCPLVKTEVEVHTSDGERLVVWDCPCPTKLAREPANRWVVLYFHGNAGNISHRWPVAEKWHRQLGADVVMFDYRGYGKSTGSPSEQGLYRDARAVYRWLIKHKSVAKDRILFWGESIGGGVAAELASAEPCGGLVLERSFTSLPDAAARHFWFLPVRWLMHNRFPTIDRIGEIRCPIFIASADKDEVVPFAHGKALFDRAGSAKQYFVLHGLGHNDPLGDDYYQAIRRFFAL